MVGSTHLIRKCRIVADSLVPGIHIVPEQRNQPELTIIIPILIFVFMISTTIIITIISIITT